MTQKILIKLYGLKSKIANLKLNEITMFCKTSFSEVFEKLPNMFPCQCYEGDYSSSQSTLSLMRRRSTKYQNYINLNAVFLLITSIVFIFCAIILMKFYQVDKLDFWDEVFLVVPSYIIVLGVYIFIIGFFGIAISGLENRCLLVMYAILMSIAFVAQIGSIFAALELRKTLAQAAASHANVNDDLNRYGLDHYVTAKWDAMQRYLHCCGGNNYLIGFNDYRSTPIGANFSVPDSCCFEQIDGCGHNIFHLSDVQIRNKIFVNGCLTLLKDQLEGEVVPIMIAYACVGVLLAIVELISVVRASAYVAQISRKRMREKQHTWVSRNQLNSQGNLTYANEDHEVMC